MRGCIFIDFLVAAALLLSTTFVAIGAACNSGNISLKNFLYFTALCARNSASAWVKQQSSRLPTAWSQTIRYLPHVSTTKAMPPAICWQYLGKRECYK